MFPLETIVGRAKRKGFVYPGSDIYGGLANAWDYGPYGSQLKKNIQDIRRQTFINERPDMVGLDSQILMHPKTWEASGHVAGFNDPLIDDKNTGERFRADKLIENDIKKIRGYDEATIIKLITELRNGFEEIEQDIGHSLQDDNLVERLETIQKKLNKDNVDAAIIEIYNFYILYSNRENLKNFKKVQNLIPESRSLNQMRDLIRSRIDNNPNTGKPADRTDVRKFAMMFYTYQGVIHDEDNKIWMRPETAQGIFLNFKNILDTTRMRIPFGIGQVGKSFRNEITPGNFLYRTREFEQMEIEYFVENDKEKALGHLEKRKKASMNFWKNILNIKEENLKFREHESDELSHYSDGTFDVEYKYPWGWGELQGIAYRTDFDLKAHQELSGKNLQYTDPYTGARYIPHVIEPSFGLSRTVLAVMFDCYDEDNYQDAKGNEQTRVVTRFPKQIAPVKFAILPLIKKNENQVAFAEKLFAQLAKQYVCEYDDGGAIGKRYRRQDEIGTPYCLTIDHDTVDPDSEHYQTVTIRDRDTMDQKRVKIDEISL